MSKTESKAVGLRKFLLVLSIVTGYFAFAVHSFGIAQGIAVTALTWSFFVFCTPIADAGFLVDFPIRLVTGIRMVYSEIIVWLVATLLNVVYFTFNSSVYQKTELLRLFHKIITEPWPLGLIIVLSAIGTFVSVLFDDHIYDLAAAKVKHKLTKGSHAKTYSMLVIFFATFLLYALLLRTTHTYIKIF